MVPAVANRWLPATSGMGWPRRLLRRDRYNRCNRKRRCLICRKAPNVTDLFAILMRWP